jgi:hypothetical protein
VKKVRLIYGHLGHGYPTYEYMDQSVNIFHTLILLPSVGGYSIRYTCIYIGMQDYWEIDTDSVFSEAFKFLYVIFFLVIKIYFWLISFCTYAVLAGPY